MKQKSTSQDIIREALVRMKVKNPSFSNNSLAKLAGISSGFLSKFLNGKKGLSVSTAISLARVLKLTENEQKYLLNELDHTPDKTALKKAKDIYTIEEDQQVFLSRWYYAAIADLPLCDGYKHDPSWIAKRLGISKLEAEEAMNRLLRMKIIVNENNKWIKKNNKAQIITKRSKVFVREFHEQMINKSIEHMKTETSDVAFALRSIRGRTMAVNPEKIDRAKEIIQDFLDNMCEVLEEDTNKEIYQLNVQLFPLTIKNSGEKS